MGGHFEKSRSAAVLETLEPRLLLSSGPWESVGGAAQAADGVTTHRALLVGVNGGTFTYADEDVGLMESALLGSVGSEWQTENVTTLIDSAATASAFEQELQTLSLVSDSDDSALVYFSGHGGTTADLDGDEADGSDETLAFYDRSVLDDEVADWISGLNPGVLTMIFDSCHSGGMVKAGESDGVKASGEAEPIRSSDGFVSDLVRQAKYGDPGQHGDAVFVTGCDDDEYSYFSHSTEASWLTYYIAEALTTESADLNSNGVISAEEAHGYAYPRVVNQHSDQHPQIQDNYAGEAGLVWLNGAPSVDLVAGSFDVSPAHPVPCDGQVTAQFSIQNGGVDSAGAFHMAFWLCDNFEGESCETLLDSMAVAGVPPGSAYQGSAILHLPIPDPYRSDNEYAVIMTVDEYGEIPEADETNNRLYASISSEGHLPYPTDGKTVVPVNLTLATPAHARIGCDEWIGAYDIDVYQFNAPSSGTYGFDIDRTAGALDSYLRVYDASWLQIASNDDGVGPGLEPSGLDSYVEANLTSGQTYYAIVSAAGNHTSNPRLLTGRSSGSVGEYALRVDGISGNQAPSINSLGISPDPVFSSGDLTLTADGVIDDHGIDSVCFYLDANGDGVGQVQELLGADGTASDGWTWSGPVTWGPGQYTYLARATDDGIPAPVVHSEWVSAQGWVGADVAYTMAIEDKASGSELPRDASGNYTVNPGQELLVEVYVDDLRPTGTDGGVFAAYADLSYDAKGLMDWISNCIVDAFFANGQSGTIDNENRMVDEAGGFDGFTAPGADPAQRLFTVEAQIRADASDGSAILLALDPADASPSHDTLVFGVDSAVSATYEAETLRVVTSWTNTSEPNDVNDDGNVTPQDALVIINKLNSEGSHALIAPGDPCPVSGAGMYWDVNDDEWITPADALSIINHLNGVLVTAPIFTPAPSAIGVANRAARTIAKAKLLPFTRSPLSAVCQSTAVGAPVTKATAEEGYGYIGLLSPEVLRASRATGLPPTRPFSTLWEQDDSEDRNLNDMAESAEIKVMDTMQIQLTVCAACARNSEHAQDDESLLTGRKQGTQGSSTYPALAISDLHILSGSGVLSVDLSPNT